MNIPTRVSMFLNKYTACVITGGSSGIGETFIRYVSNVSEEILICNLSRKKPKIILSKGTLVHFPCDLRDPSQLDFAVSSVLQKLKEEGKIGPILLINNSGFGACGLFGEIDRQRQLDMIAVNVQAVVDLTHRFLPILRERGGAIVNNASIAAFQPTPYLATYGATKSFLLHWSWSLGEELKGSGVRVLAVCPGPTATAFFSNAGFETSPVSSLWGQQPGKVVVTALCALERGKRVVISGWKNRLMVLGGCGLPKTWLGWLSRKILKKIIDRRRKLKH